MFNTYFGQMADTQKRANNNLEKKSEINLVKGYRRMLFQKSLLTVLALLKISMQQYIIKIQGNKR